MWISLADENLIEVYNERFLPDDAPEIIVELLKKLNKKSYAEKISAFTSVGNLYLTTATSWNDYDKNYAIQIDQKTDAGKILISISSNLEGAKKSAINRECSINEAVEYVDLFVIGILLKKYGEL